VPLLNVAPVVPKDVRDTALPTAKNSTRLSKVFCLLVPRGGIMFMNNTNLILKPTYVTLESSMRNSESKKNLNLVNMKKIKGNDNNDMMKVT
jgi:hypothetical protein